MQIQSTKNQMLNENLDAQKKIFQSVKYFLFLSVIDFISDRMNTKN